MMMEWTAEITTDPDRGHELHVELKDGERYRARLFQDEHGMLQLQLYDGHPGVLPVQWLLGVIARFSEDLNVRKRKETE